MKTKTMVKGKMKTGRKRKMKMIIKSYSIKRLKHFI